MSDQLTDPQTTAAPTPPAEPVAADSPQALTSYVVLERVEVQTIPDSDPLIAWEVVDQAVPARSAEAALRAYVEGNPTGQPVTLVAVPTRSWRPQKITPKTTLVVEEVAS